MRSTLPYPWSFRPALTGVPPVSQGGTRTSKNLLLRTTIIGTEHDCH